MHVRNENMSVLLDTGDTVSLCCLIQQGVKTSSLVPSSCEKDVASANATATGFRAEHLTRTGHSYGYPKCCVHSFVTQGGMRKAFPRQRVATYIIMMTGFSFIPCYACASAICDGKITKLSQMGVDFSVRKDAAADYRDEMWACAEQAEKEKGR